MAARRTTVQKPEDVTPGEVAGGHVSASDPRDAALAGYREFKVNDANATPIEHDRQIRVKNVPADRCCTWATDPRIDNGACVSLYRSLGFRLVEVDEVAADMNDDRKLSVSHFEEGPNRSVAMGGGVLMIGYRQYRDERRAAAMERARTNVAEGDAKLDTLGIRHGGTTARGSLTEV